MKKLFFFRSSSSSNGNNNNGSLPSTDKQVYWDIPLETGLNSHGGDKADNSFRSPKGLFSKSRKQVYDNPTSSSMSSYLRRSRSMSSAGFLVDGLEQRDFSCIDDQSRSPSSSINSAAHQRCDHQSRRRAITPERQAKAKRFESTTIQNAYGQDRSGSSGSSKSHHDSSGSSTSSNISSKVLDRYIDGEHQQERSKPKNTALQRNFAVNGNAGGKLPPRVQYTAPASPTDGGNDKHRSQSFREAKGTRLHFSSRDWVENGFGHESPRRLAKNVIERLSQTHSFRKSSLKEFNHDIPITIEDIYAGSMNKCVDSNIDIPSQKSYSPEEPYETINSYNGDDFVGSQNQTGLLGNNFGDMNTVQQEMLELWNYREDLRKLSRRNITEDRLSLAIEVSSLLNNRISERDASREELRLAKTELESQTRRLEKEKSELQSALEKELDRRSSDWSLKLEKYQLEEHRLRERVRELAEQNVSLQREVSSFSEREAESRSVITYSEQQLKHLTSKLEEVSKEKHELIENLSELQDKYKVAEEDLNCIKRNFEEKDKECKELQKSTARLLRTCKEQEKTVEGLREAYGEEIEKKLSLEEFDKRVTKMQMEQMRLTGAELALRREAESHRIEIDSLRHENIGLLNRLKCNGKRLVL
ncbi:hypothetical protein GH714_034721 [Hevea brasiliensis]|uniref:DUF7653 domain-containing protein n=1 Tax=Hevea brasiliensis TaxID=3981 RepID=A0A6A6L3F4_HEVBR|nr:hypothetical protein GH714_034721 [Hevea brasiliensis]